MRQILIKYLLLSGIIIFLQSCEEIIPKPPNTGNLPGINFKTSFEFLDENADSPLQVELYLGQATKEQGSFDITIISPDATYGNDYTTTPSGSGGSFTINLADGATAASFSIAPVDNSDEDGNKVINFEITAVSGGVSLGSSLEFELTIVDDEGYIPVTGDYADCLNQLSNNTLDVVTWNIEQFSASNTNTTLLAEMIEVMDADIIGLQEINSISDFTSMVNNIQGWSVKFVNQGDGISLGYLFKDSEITSDGSLYTIYDDNSSAFPRAPVIGNFTHTPSGLQFTIFNLHLKCCDDGEDRRKNAAVLLKGYVDANLDTENVIIIGDYNDEIQESPATNVFQVFIDDASNYKFTDMAIAQGSSLNWSYPSWPSHLDHIMITDELFDEWESASTLKLDVCKSSYRFDISDHRPVLARFKVN